MAIAVYCVKCDAYFSKKNVTSNNDKCPNCGLSLKNVKKFRINVRTPDDRRITKVVEGSIVLARQVESNIKSDVAKGKHLGFRQEPFLSDIWKKYINWAEDNKKSWKDDKDRWEKHVAPYVIERRMDELLPKDIQKVIDIMVKNKTPRGKSYAPATIKQVRDLIRGVYNWAIRLEYYYGPNPAVKVKPPKVDNQKTECLEKDECRRLLNVLDNWDNRIGALMVKFTLLTGLRKSEVFKLQWDNVDLKKGFMSLIDPKGKPTTIAISFEAVEVLVEAMDNQPVEGCMWVFPNWKGEKRVSFNNTWYRIRDKAQIPKKFRFHDLRHTFASYVASSGKVDMYTLQKLLNHQTPQMTQRYAHLLDEALRRGADVAGEVFAGAGSKAGPDKAGPSS